MCYLNDERVLTAIPADILDRMLGNADTILNIEAPGFANWQPSRRQLADLKVPVVLIVARDTLPVYRAVVEWLAAEFKVEPITVPGRHAFYYYRPQDLADVLRPIVRGFARD
jgi:pimeloyl-ACP methyl ester carboxylesterase